MSGRATPARRIAFEVVERVFEQGAWADRAFATATQGAGLEARDRALAQRLAYGTVQRRGTLDQLIGGLSDRAVDDLDPGVRAALRLGAYELLFTSGSPDRAAVDQAVELAKAAGSGRGTGFVNAVLRRVARERETLLASFGEDDDPARAAVAHSIPEWLARMWWRELGSESARSLVRVANEPAETSLRSNSLRTEREALAASLRESGVAASSPDARPPLAAPEALVVAGPLGEGGAARIEAGEALPQSRASMAVVEVLDPRPGDQVLDLCAGPGTKTTQIAARLGNRGEVISVEVDRSRAAAIGELCERLGARCVSVVEADASSLPIGDGGGGYDRVLVDPPCSDLGTLAARPDVRWRKTPDQIDRLAGLQGDVLATGAAALRPGGALVYSTCTISARENEDRVLALLGSQAGAGLDADDLGDDFPGLESPRDRRFLQIRPDRDRTDGFFIARLRRTGG